MNIDLVYGALYAKEHSQDVMLYAGLIAILYAASLFFGKLSKSKLTFGIFFLMQLGIFGSLIEILQGCLEIRNILTRFNGFHTELWIWIVWAALCIYAFILFIVQMRMGKAATWYWQLIPIFFAMAILFWANDLNQKIPECPGKKLHKKEKPVYMAFIKKTSAQRERFFYALRIRLKAS